jgi:uncharacterized membrane protein HdeD (DUF308 family)
MIWLPTPVYKFLPYFYAISGIICIVLGFSAHARFGQIMYVLSGVILLLAGSKVAHMRWKSQHL